MRWVLILMAAVLCIWPSIGVVEQCLRQNFDQRVVENNAGGKAGDWMGLARTVGYCSVIGFIASVAGFGGAWVIRSGAGRWAWALLVLPTLLPSYLAYAGWGILRGPGSMLGDWIAQREPWVSVAAGKVFAVWGMVLWSWPIAALVMGVMLSRLPDALLDTIRLEQCSRWMRMRLWMRVTAPAFGVSMGAVGILMCGSAIPLHVAQVETYAINLWRVMQTSESMRQVWTAAIPLMAIAAGGAWVLVWMMNRAVVLRDQDHQEQSLISARVPRRWKVWMGVVWCCSVLIPMGLFASSIVLRKSVWDFWMIHRGALLESLKVALCVGGIGVMLASLTAVIVAEARSPRSRRLGSVEYVCLGMLVMMGLMAGVLVGSAFGAAAAMIPGLELGNVMTALTHLARFGWLGVGVGCIIGLAEDPSSRLSRELEGAGFGSTVYGVLRPMLGVLAGLFLALVSLSVHEIESTIMVMPPGASPIARVMLDHLHFSRDEELSAAAVNMTGAGLIVALAGAWLMGGLRTGLRTQRQ